jgi:hypothetical protein
MAKPVWSITQPSNSSLGTFVERQTLGVGSVPIINLLVSDPENVDNIETFQFLNNVLTYSTLNEVYIKSNGIARTSWLGQPSEYNKYNPRAQSYVFRFPLIRSAAPITSINNPIPALGNIGVAIDGVPFRSPNSGKTTTLGGKIYTENKVIYPVQDFFTDGSGIIESDRSFFYHSDPTLLYVKNTIVHSPLLGFAFDGLPIYGPYGYRDPMNQFSGVKVMRSNYQITEVQRANGTVPDGTFIEDFEYVEGLGDLDEYNSRFCKTPEFPNGTQAYFVTVDPDDHALPRYPYIIGPRYWGKPTLPNGGFSWPKEIDISLISGKLPSGLRIEGLTIVGTPYAVISPVTSRFVLRAKNLDGISDRTFNITISNLVESLMWETLPGALPVGANNHYYILDNSLIDFQLDAIDNDLPSGKYINYHIPPNGGELPGGISLSRTGRLYGFTAPLLAVDTGGDLGKFDTTLYDKFGYDYGVRPMNGYDSFYFDNQTYDYYNPNRAPKKLNRYYQFIIRASDGVRYVDRQFKIFVVGDDYMRADNDILHIGTNTYTADNTYMRKTIWITPKYLGRLRANNYITIIMDVFDPATLEGTIGFILANTNDDGSPSVLPPGMVLDQLSGNVYGSVPYQPAITKTYKFTINALRYSVDPTVPNVPSYRTFTVDIIGDIDSIIHFTTSGDLGSIDANFISNLSVSAITTVPNVVLVYNLVSGRLPPGLTLVNDGTIQGKVNQFATNESPGLITFDNNTTIFDNYTTTIDRSYKFTIEARDQFNQSAVTKTFKLSINTPNNKLYSNLYVKPFLSLDMRTKMKEFFNNSSIFDPKSIYRLSDPEFGIQNELKMLLYPGIETKEISEYISAFGRTSIKKFRIGSLKKSIAKIPETNTDVYELIYLEIIDSLETTQGSVSKYIPTFTLNHGITVNQGRRDVIDRDMSDDNLATMTIDSLSSVLIQDRVMTVDYGGQFISDSNKSNVFGNSTTNIRDNISIIGDTERNYLPLWMRTPQTSSGVEQGFTKAVPICYCIPGAADNIILNILNSGFDFKMINYTVDRAIIDSVVGDVGDKYIAFPAREVING